MVWGDLPQPPALSEDAVVVVTSVSTGGLCWKMLAMLGTGRQWHGKGCREMPRRHHRTTARSHPMLLQQFGLLRCGRGGGGKEPTRRQQGVVAPLPGWGPALPPRCRDPAGQDPPCAEQEGEEHPWVAKRVECVQHLARKCWLLRKHGTFHPCSGLSVFWGGGKGLPVTYQLHTTCCLSLLDDGSGFPRRPPTPRSSPLRVFGALQAVVETQELSAGWDLLLRRSTKS